MNQLEAHKLTELANTVFDNETKAQAWLHTPLKSLEDQTPVAIAGQNAEGYARVVQRLNQMNFGITS